MFQVYGIGVGKLEWNLCEPSRARFDHVDMQCEAIDSVQWRG